MKKPPLAPDSPATAEPERELRRLEEVVADWAALRGRRPFQRHRAFSWPRVLESAGEHWIDRMLEEIHFTNRALAELLALAPEEQGRWIEARSWAADGIELGDRLLEVAANRPLADRLDLARLAARVILRTPVPPADWLFQVRTEDVLCRAGLLEVRVLRRRGRLEEARQRFQEVEEIFAADRSALYLWLTLDAERALTKGLLARDEGRIVPALVAFSRAKKLFAIAGSEDDDFELLGALARTDLLRGDAPGAVDRLTRAPEFQERSRRIETGFLRVSCALRTSSPLAARLAALGLLSELGGSRDRALLDGFRVTEAAVRLAEGQPSAALEALTGPAESLRAAGSLLGSLRAGLVACRAELGRKRRAPARAALRAGLLEHFTDLPDIPAVRAVLTRITAEGSTGPSPEFLDRLDLWLILVEDSPAVGFPDSPLS